MEGKYPFAEGIAPKRAGGKNSFKIWREPFYSWLAQRILSGAIECEPDEDACTYCDFHDICRYHGQPYVREAIITREGTYAEGKEEQHAEVE